MNIDLQLMANSDNRVCDLIFQKTGACQFIIDKHVGCTDRLLTALRVERSANILVQPLSNRLSILDRIRDETKRHVLMLDH